VAAVTSRPRLPGPSRDRWRRASRLIGEAAAGGARLAAFPETWMPGYPAWIFGAAGWEDRRLEARVRASAPQRGRPCGGDAVNDALRRPPAAHGIQVIIGVNELDDALLARHALQLAALHRRRGHVSTAVHRKLMPTHAERIVWGMGDGSTLHVLETPLGSVGALICWEHWMPLARFALHARGEQVHVAVLARGLLRDRARLPLLRLRGPLLRRSPPAPSSRCRTTCPTTSSSPTP
jgi:nitrilase